MKSGRSYTLWSEQAKEAFDKEFGNYVKQDFGYPSKYNLSTSLHTVKVVFNYDSVIRHFYKTK